MKKILLFTALILILINTSIGLVYQNYAIHKVLFADISIVLTFIMLYISASIQTSDGFRIGYAGLLGFTGLARFICAIMLDQEVKNSISLIVFLILFSIECIALMATYSMRNK
jgi:hypothetical protein